MKIVVHHSEGFSQYGDAEFFVGNGGELVIHADPDDGKPYDETTWKRGLIMMYSPGVWRGVRLAAGRRLEEVA